MRNEDYLAKYVQCPFYTGSTAHSVRCEAILDGGANTVNTFEGSPKEFMQSCCMDMDKWKDCQIARILWEKY